MTITCKTLVPVQTVVVHVRRQPTFQAIPIPALFDQKRFFLDLARRRGLWLYLEEGKRRAPEVNDSKDLWLLNIR